MKAIKNNEFVGKFCLYNGENFTELSNKFKLGKNKRPLVKLNIYITSELEVCFTSLTSDELKRLNLQEIELIDGLWYIKDEIEK